MLSPNTLSLCTPIPVPHLPTPPLCISLMFYPPLPTAPFQLLVLTNTPC